MIDEIFSGIGEMFTLLFHGLWKLTKILSIAFYKFLKKHPRYACLLPILLFATYFRFTYIFSSSGFLGIDPEDIRIVGNLLSGNLLLLGRLILPGHITLGPFYEYLIAPPFWIVGADPLGPAILSGVLSVATVYLVYLIGKQFFSLQAGLFAAGLYAVSPFVTSYVHLSWNIDMLPFFSLLLLWVIFNAAASARPFLYYLSAGYLLGLCLQLHYMALFLVILVVLYMIITEIIVKGKRFIVPFLLHFFELLSGFLISSLPFLYYEALKGFPNTKALWEYLITISHSTTFIHILFSIPQTFFMLFVRLMVNFPTPDSSIYYAPIEVTLIGYFAMFLFVVSCLILLFFARNRFVSIVLFLWLILGAFSLCFFTNDVYEYHFSILYPVCFLLVGNFLATIFHFADQERVKLAKQLISQNAEGETYTMIPVDVTDNKKLILHITSIGISVVLFFIIVLLNVAVLPYRYLTSEKKVQIKDIVTFVAKNVDKKPFNFALLTTPNTMADQNAYANELGQLGNRPIQIQHLEIDPQRKSITDFLYVVCEIQCKPLESQVWYIKGFGDAAILDHWSIDGTTVYKLVHVIER